MDTGAKRAKTGSVQVSGPSKAPRVFRPFRTVGLVSNGVPCAVTNLGQNYIVSTAVGRSIQIYDAASLRLLFMTQPQTTEDIECIQSYYHHVFAVSGSDLLVYRRGQLEVKATIPGKESKQRALNLIIFGGYVCVATADRVSVFKWSPKTKDLSFYTELTTPRVLGSIVDITHPPTYINKIVVATQSCLVLFNVKTGKTIHTFNEVYQGITKVEAAPTALDMVAIVSGNGDVILLNLRTDIQIFTLSTGEPITALGFRSDTGTGSAALLGLGTADGDVFFYDLDLRRRVQSLRSFAHNHKVCSVQFLPGQPIVIVNGADNTLTELVFDPPMITSSSKTAKNVGGHRARVLRRRGGHGMPSSCLLFADEEAHFLLSGSLDQSLWAFSLRKDSQSHAFGGVQKVDLPPITDMAYAAEKRERWDTLVTAHKSSNEVRTWSVKRGALGNHKFVTGDGSICKSVAVSNCGNFAVLGSAKGGIIVYNLQSGIQRMKLDNVHKSAVTGVTLLPNNSVLISASLDGSVKFFKFGTVTNTLAGNNVPKCIAFLDLGHGAVTGMRLHPGSGLLAVSTDSMALVLIDTTTHRVVREFWGHGNTITTFDFTPSGRWIISASLDSTIRTWDIPSGACIDGVKLANPATNLRISPNSEWVATSHVRGVGIQMWSLRSTFDGLSFRNIEEEDMVDIDMPTVSGENGVSLLEGILGTGEITEDAMNLDDETVAVEPATSSEQLAPGIVTMSGQPANKFTTLVHLDAIRERNKPKQGLQKPEKAPFFLGLPTDDPSSSSNNKNNGISSGELSTVNSKEVSSLTHLLEVGDLEGIPRYMAQLGPAATDLEIRSLDTQAPYSELVAFIDAMALLAQKGLQFELVQAWMNIFLRAHGDVFNEVGSELLQRSFNNWLEAHKRCVVKMQDHARFCSGILTYLRQQ